MGEEKVVVIARLLVYWVDKKMLCFAGDYRPLSVGQRSKRGRILISMENVVESREKSGCGVGR